MLTSLLILSKGKKIKAKDDDNKSDGSFSQSTQVKSVRSEEDFTLSISEKLGNGQKNIFKIVNNSRKPSVVRGNNAPKRSVDKAVDIFNLLVKEAKVNFKNT